jgi:hypothetical protein
MLASAVLLNYNLHSQDTDKVINVAQDRPLVFTKGEGNTHFSEHLLGA